MVGGFVEFGHFVPEVCVILEVLNVFLEDRIGLVGLINCGECRGKEFFFELGPEVIFGGLSFGLFIKNDFFNEFFLDLLFDFLLVELGGNGLVELGFGGLKFHADFILFSLALIHLLFSPLYGLNTEFLLYFLLDFLPIDLFI